MAQRRITMRGVPGDIFSENEISISAGTNSVSFLSDIKLEKDKVLKFKNEFTSLMFSKPGYTGSQIPRPLKIESEVLESSAQELIMLSTSL